ncbi:hypothetical protein CRUP_019326, partial [Coryphaenoides rupestris]
PPVVRGGKVTRWHLLGRGAAVVAEPSAGGPDTQLPGGGGLGREIVSPAPSMAHSCGGLDPGWRPPAAALSPHLHARRPEENAGRQHVDGAVASLNITSVRRAGLSLGLQQGSSSSLARQLCDGAVAAFVTTPLDVAKTRIMLAKAGTVTASGNIPLVLLDVWKSRGLSGLFAGSIPRVTFISIGGFIFLGAYEKVRSTLL